MAVKGAFVVYDVNEETSPPGQVKASCNGRVFDGSGTGSHFQQDFVFDPAAPNVNTQIHDAVKTYMQNSLSVSFGPTDVLLMLPAIL